MAEPISDLRGSDNSQRAQRWLRLIFWWPSFADIWKGIREWKEVDAYSDFKGANILDIESTAKKNIFLSNSQTANIMRTGKSGAETNLMQPSRDREVEELSNFAFLGLMLSYAILYILYSANLGRKSNNRRVTIGLHVWTIFMMMLLLIFPYVRCSARAVKVARLVMSGLIFVSSCIVFVLLQRAM